MLKKPIYSLALVALMGAVAACGGEEEGAVTDDAMITDTLVTPETQTVETQVTVPDTSVVVTEVDTTRDTVDVEQR